MTPLSPLDLVPHITRVFEAIKDLPVEQQQAVLEAATAGARAAVELRQRLFMQGSLVASFNKR